MSDITTGDITTTLAALVIALAAIDPSPQPVPANIYNWPVDFDNLGNINYDTFPFIIVAQVVNRWFPFTDVAHSLTSNTWPAEINIALAEGPLSKLEAAQAAEKLQVPWVKALATVLSANRSMDGNTIAIGTGEQLYRYRIGHWNWDNAQVFWGLRAEVTMIQQHSMSAS